MSSEQHMEQLESLRQENKEYHTNFEEHLLMCSFLIHSPSLLADYSKINEERKIDTQQKEEYKEFC